MPQFSVFDANTGEILRTGHCSDPKDVAIQSHASHEIIHDELLDLAETYMPGSVITPRPLLFTTAHFDIIANDQDALHRTDMPNGTLIGFDREQHTVEDGEFHFSSGVPGVFTFEIQPPFPHQRQFITVTAHAA